MRIHPWIAPLVGAIVLASTAAAQAAATPAPETKTNIYTGPDLVVLYPVEGTAIFVSVVLIASVIEYGIEWLMSIDDDYFQLVYASVAEETIVVSILVMAMIFASSIGELSTKWVQLLNFAVLSLVLMVGFFVAIIGCCVFLLRLQANRWRLFERTRIDADPKLSSRETLFRACRDRFRESIEEKGIDCKPDSILLSEYLHRMERFTVAEVCDLQWKSWAALALLVVINGVRATITTTDDARNTAGAAIANSDRTANVVSYVVLVGYATLGFYGIMHAILQARLSSWVKDPVVVPSPHANEDDVFRSSVDALYFSRFDNTVQIFQSAVLVLEWYISVFVLGMAYELFGAYGTPVALGFIAFALLPLVIFVVLLPWSISVMTLLNCLGRDLSAAEVQTMVDAAKGHDEAVAAVVGDDSDDDGAGDDDRVVHTMHGGVKIGNMTVDHEIIGDHPNSRLAQGQGPGALERVKDRGPRSAFATGDGKPIFLDPELRLPPQPKREDDDFADVRQLMPSGVDPINLTASRSTGWRAMQRPSATAAPAPGYRDVELELL